MKKLAFFSLVLLLAACGNQPAAVEATTPTTTPSGNDGLGVAITVFAQLQRGSAGNLDGEYDAKEEMFIPCGSTQGMAIKPEEVKIISGGSCDGLAEKMEPERLIVVNRSGGSFKVVSRSITLQDVTSEKGKGQYETKEGTRPLVLDAETMNRIKASRTLMEKVRRK